MHIRPFFHVHGQRMRPSAALRDCAGPRTKRGHDSLRFVWWDGGHTREGLVHISLTNKYILTKKHTYFALNKRNMWFTSNMHIFKWAQVWLPHREDSIFWGQVRTAIIKAYVSSHSMISGASLLSIRRRALHAYCREANQTCIRLLTTWTQPGGLLHGHWACDNVQGVAKHRLRRYNNTVYIATHGSWVRVLETKN